MKEWKAAEKEAQKMTRDGAISVNMVTGEASRVSDRAPEQDYSSSGDSTAFVRSAAERLDDRRIHKSEKKKRRKRAGPTGRVRRPTTVHPPVCSSQARNAPRRSCKK